MATWIFFFWSGEEGQQFNESLLHFNSNLIICLRLFSLLHSENISLDPAIKHNGIFTFLPQLRIRMEKQPESQCLQPKQHAC